MARDIPVGNGQMLVCFDQHYQIRDLYFPHVGQEDHCGAGPCRFGVYATLPHAGEKDHPRKSEERRRRRLYWSDQGWDVDLSYEDDTLSTRVRMSHDPLELTLNCTDVVDFHRNVLVRRIDVHNRADVTRDVRLIHHNNFEMYGTKVGDTAYYDPKLRSLVHYRRTRYLMTSWHVEGEQRIDEYATGTAGFLNAEGTWRDAEDGVLGNNAIAQGAVDSTILARLTLGPHAKQTAYFILGAGQSKQDLADIQRFVHRQGPQHVIDRTTAYWRLWLGAARTDFPEPEEGGPNEKVVSLFKRSLLLVRTQIDNTGAIIAANDSDYLQYSRDTYSYLWPRDGALVAAALDDAGFPDVARSFYSLCARIIEPGGYFLHKYNPDGSPASSWHPWVSLGKPQLPIQEDETALVIWALWRHYTAYRDIEFVRPLWLRLIQPAADFLVRFRDPESGLPLPSYGLWETFWGVHSFTVASVYAGLKAAWHFATCFGDTHRADRYGKAAERMRDAYCDLFWSEQLGRFHRRVVPLDHDRTARLMAEILEGREPEDELHPSFAAFGNGNGNGREKPDIAYEFDGTIDASMFSLFAFGMLNVHDKRVEQTMEAVEKRLWVKTPVGGIARFEGDDYHKTSDDLKSVPGNPWFICTLWLAQWYIAKANSALELRNALPMLEWVAAHALPSGVLSEQVHPHTNAPLSVAPLTWSHATVVAVAAAYRNRLEQMHACPLCGQPQRTGQHGWLGTTEGFVPPGPPVPPVSTG